MRQPLGIGSQLADGISQTNCRAGGGPTFKHNPGDLDTVSRLFFEPDAKRLQHTTYFKERSMNRKRQHRRNDKMTEKTKASAERMDEMKESLDEVGGKHFDNAVISDHVREPVVARASGLTKTRAEIDGEVTTIQQFIVSGAGRTILIWQSEDRKRGVSPLFVDGFEFGVQDLSELTDREPDWAFGYDTTMPTEEQLHLLGAALECQGKEAANQIMWTYLSDNAPQAKNMSAEEFLGES